MAKKRKKEQSEHICSECGHGRWIQTHRNMDYQGNPICLRCDNSETARIRDWAACEHFTPKQQ